MYHATCTYGMTYKSKALIRGHWYLYERESYWDRERKKTRQRTVRCLGRCDEHGNLTEPVRPRVDAVYTAFPVGPMAAFYAASQELNVRRHIQDVLSLDEHHASMLLLIALNQASHRLPLNRVPEWARASPFPVWEGVDPASITRQSLDESLGALCSLSPSHVWQQHGYDLQDALTRQWRGSSREPAAYYYDITKQHYYGSACPYAEMGHDADRGLSRVIGFGMVISREHKHPVHCRPLNGSVNDTVTVSETVDLMHSFGLKGITLVMDRGMVSASNLSKVLDAGYKQVGLVRGWNRTTMQYASRWSGDALERPEYAVARSNGYAAYARAFDGSLFGRRMRIAVVEDPRRKAEERQARDLLLLELQGNPVRGRLREIRNELGPVVIPSRGRRGFRVDAKAVERERSLDGRFLLFGTDTGMHAREMYELYFQRDAVEKVFRTAKGELCAGPIRYRRKDRVDAYATVLYIAYLLWSWTERKVKEKYPGMTMDETIRSIENVMVVKFGTDKLVREWSTRRTQEQEELLSAIGATRFLPAT